MPYVLPAHSHEVFHQQLVQYLDVEQQPISIESATEDADPDLREQLRALGYVE